MIKEIIAKFKQYNDTLPDNEPIKKIINTFFKSQVVVTIENATKLFKKYHIELNSIIKKILKNNEFFNEFELKIKEHIINTIEYCTTLIKNVKPHKHTDACKITAELVLDKTITEETAALKANVTTRTIRKWKHKLINKIPFKAKRKEYETKVEPHIKMKIKAYVTANKIIKINRLIALIFKTYGIKISETTIYNVLAKFTVTHKRTSHRKVRTKRDKNEIRRFVKDINKIPQHLIISFDEAGIYNNYHPTEGWSFSGTKCYVKDRKTTIKKYNLLCAICDGKVIASEINKENTNSDIFLNFLYTHIFFNKKYENHYILMDNASFHKSKIVRELVPDFNKFIFIVPFTPELNPIEKVFGFLKHALQTPSNRNSLEESINFVLKNITQQTINNFFRKSFTFAP